MAPFVRRRAEDRRCFVAGPMEGVQKNGEEVADVVTTFHNILLVVLVVK